MKNVPEAANEKLPLFLIFVPLTFAVRRWRYWPISVRHPPVVFRGPAISLRLLSCTIVMHCLLLTAEGHNYQIVMA